MYSTITRHAEIVEPLSTLQLLRTKLEAHAGASEAVLIRRELLKQFRKPRAPIHLLAIQLAASIEAIESIVGSSSRDFHEN
jgi:hypothetical protein